MNVILRGKTKETLELMVKAGYANTLSEAVRLAITNFKKEHLTDDELMGLAIDKIDQEVKEGKRKMLTPEEALGDYAKYLKQSKK